MIPWWLKVDMAERLVDSCPPPSVPVDTKIPAYFPWKPPEVQTPLVLSQNAYIAG